MLQEKVAESTTMFANVTVQDLINTIEKLPDPALYVAVTAWLLLYVIGWFGGIKAHKTVFLVTVISSTLIGLLSLRVPGVVIKWLMTFWPGVFPVFLVMTIYMLLIIAMAVSLYETWVVTQEEIRSDKG